MRSKLTPMLANCAVLLAIIVLSGTIARAGNIVGANTIEIGPALDTQLADVMVNDYGINANEVINADQIVIDQKLIDSVDIEAIDPTTVEGSNITITNHNQIEAPIVDVETLRHDIGEEVSPIATAKTINDASYPIIVDRDIQAIAFVDSDIA